MNNQIDLREILPTIKVPTLVMNRTGDPAADVSAARDLAARIPGARFVEFPGDTHSMFVLEPERVIAEIEEFITGSRQPFQTDRVLASILFLDIVGSTERASTIGDAAWTEVLARHDAAAEREVAAYNGHVVDHAGDGLLATFDGPARAIRCARAIQRTALGLNLQVRAGLHTGEVEKGGDGIRGIAVHTAGRIASLAGPQEILVSGTVKDLVAGSGIAFADRGVHPLKGIGEPRQVYAVTDVTW
jgi:class 3 adenylate cyclase